MNKVRIAVVLVKGEIRVKYQVKQTLAMFHLYRRNNCSIVDLTPVTVGMLAKVKDMVTWGEIDKETFKLLLEKRGKLPGHKPLTSDYLKEKIKSDFDSFAQDFMSFKKEFKDIPGLKKFFRLNPPAHGFDRKGIKVPYSLGGALGYRKEKINDLVKRMI